MAGVPGPSHRSRSEARETEILHGGGRAYSDADETQVLRGAPEASAADTDRTAVLPSVGSADTRIPGDGSDARRPDSTRADGWSAFDRPSARRTDAFPAAGETRPAPAVRDPWADQPEESERPARSARSEGPGATHDPHEVTVQLDGVGLHLDNMLRAAKDAPRGSESSDGPVFVDESGRRSRRFRRIGMAVGLACAVYAVVIVATLLSGNSDAPWLPVENPKEKRRPGRHPAAARGVGTAALRHRQRLARYFADGEHGRDRVPGRRRQRVRRLGHRREPGHLGRPEAVGHEEHHQAGHRFHPGPGSAHAAHHQRPRPEPDGRRRPHRGADRSRDHRRTRNRDGRERPERSLSSSGGARHQRLRARRPVPGVHLLMASRTRRHGPATGAPDGSRRRRVPMRLLLPSLVLVALMAMLMLRGYVHSEILADHRVQPATANDKVPSQILKGGPVIDTRSGRTTTLRVPDNSVVLTFDDGPDPEWTPKVLDALKRNNAHAVFFITGTMASRYPDLVQRMVDEGHEIGLHTFNHPDLSYQSKKRIDWELSQNQLALAGSVGIRSSLFRPPYSSKSVNMDNNSWPVTEYIGGRGYITVVNDTDSEDWRKPGVEEIVRNSMPKSGKGAIVLMHDSGGDRHQTVQALDKFIPQLQARGYEFQNLTEALDAPSAHTQVTGLELWKGKAWIFLVHASDNITAVLVVGLAIIGSLVLARFGLMLLLSAMHARRTRRRDFVWGPNAPVTEPASVLVPAYNEAKCIENTVQSLMRSEHPIEVIVIDDGSSDGTARIVEAMGLPNVRVIRQLNGGKPSALNRGLANARYDLIVMMDGDTVFEPATVRELVQPFADPRVGAVAGNAKVGNKDTLIGAWQHIEYVMGFNLDRRMYDVLQCMPTIPGAVGAFRRSALERVGGMSDDTLAEDTDITMAIHRDGWRVVYEEKARAWTEAPESVQQLWSQRYRWSYGTMQAIWKHRKALVEKGPSGRFGRVGLPLVSLFMVLAPLLAPLIDVFLIYGLIFGPTEKTILAWFGVLAVQAACAAYAFILDRERLTPLISLPLQQILYRQLMYVVLLQSWITALTGGRLRWQKLRRKGGVSAPPTVPTQRRQIMDERPVR
ncbi:Undecaprenyl-phosphate 4-deoxy-4-formamido-L-arabinose transferase [Streptomyces chartreusis]